MNKSAQSVSRTSLHPRNPTGGRAKWFHPFRVVNSFPGLPWVSRGATHGYSDCIPPGCAVTERAEEIPEFGWGFESQSADGKLVMHQDCPEIEWGKAKVRDNEECTVSAGGGWQPDVRQTRREIRGRRSETIPESRCDLVLYGAGGKWLMRKECPKFQWGNAGSSRLNAKGRNNNDCTVFFSIGVAGKPGASQKGAGEIPESRCNFVLQDADGEWLMSQDCPGFSRPRTGSPRHDGGRYYCIRAIWRTGGIGFAGVGKSLTTSTEIPERRDSTEAQDIEHKGVTSEEKIESDRVARGERRISILRDLRGASRGGEFGGVSGGRAVCRLGSRPAAKLHPYAGWATCATTLRSADGLWDARGRSAFVPALGGQGEKGFARVLNGLTNMNQIPERCDSSEAQDIEHKGVTSEETIESGAVGRGERRISVPPDWRRAWRGGG